jgi:hypothetical protein
MKLLPYSKNDSGAREGSMSIKDRNQEREL